MTAQRTSRNPLTWLLTAAVRGYQLVVSPWFAPSCRYYPSCSAYAIGALRVHGPVVGLGLAAWRLLRCNPWSKGGVDLVPERGRLPWQRRRPYTSQRRGDGPADAPPSGADRLAYDRRLDHRPSHQSPQPRI